MFVITRRKHAQAVRRPVSLRDHLVYATMIGQASIIINVIVLLAIALVVFKLATNDHVQHHVSQWRAAEQRDLLLGNIPSYTSEACYTTLLKRLQATTDVLEDGTVEISEVVWQQPAGDCSNLGPFP